MDGHFSKGMSGYWNEYGTIPNGVKYYIVIWAHFNGTLDKYNIIPHFFPKKSGDIIRSASNHG